MQDSRGTIDTEMTENEHKILTVLNVTGDISMDNLLTVIGKEGLDEAEVRKIVMGLIDEGKIITTWKRELRAIRRI